MGEYVSVDVDHAAHIATVWISSGPVNAFRQPVYAEIRETFTSIGEHGDIRAVVLASAARHFCVGNDLAEFQGMGPGNVAERMAVVRAAYESIRDCPVPVIAALKGAVLGAGISISGVVDLLVAAESTYFGLPEINIGVMGGARHAIEFLPQHLVKWMFFTGEFLPVAKAAPYGGILDVVPDDTVIERATEVAKSISRHAPIAIKLAKADFYGSAALDIKAGYAYEQAMTGELANYPESQEALAAFLEKREPNYR